MNNRSIFFAYVSVFYFPCKLMVVGVNGADGVSVLRQSVAYKQGLENVLIQSQHMVENIAMELEQL